MEVYRQALHFTFAGVAFATGDGSGGGGGAGAASRTAGACALRASVWFAMALLVGVFERYYVYLIGPLGAYLLSAEAVALTLCEFGPALAIAGAPGLPVPPPPPAAGAAARVLWALALSSTAQFGGVMLGFSLLCLYARRRFVAHADRLVAVDRRRYSDAWRHAAQADGARAAAEELARLADAARALSAGPVRQADARRGHGQPPAGGVCLDASMVIVRVGPEPLDTPERAREPAAAASVDGGAPGESAALRAFAAAADAEASRDVLRDAVGEGESPPTGEEEEEPPAVRRLAAAVRRLAAVGAGGGVCLDRLMAQVDSRGYIYIYIYALIRALLCMCWTGVSAAGARRSLGQGVAALSLSLSLSLSLPLSLSLSLSLAGGRAGPDAAGPVSGVGRGLGRGVPCAWIW